MCVAVFFFFLMSYDVLGIPKLSRNRKRDDKKMRNQDKASTRKLEVHTDNNNKRDSLNVSHRLDFLKLVLEHKKKPILPPYFFFFTVTCDDP